jgi:hypothetical protein
VALAEQDRIHITDLINLHGHLLDAGDLDRAGELFTPDVVYDVTDFGFGSVHGTAALREYLLAARDFADIYILARRFGKDVLLARAARIDAGFDVRVLADMIATLDRFTDSEIPVPDGSFAAELRAFYAAWGSELAA